MEESVQDIAEQDLHICVIHTCDEFHLDNVVVVK